MSSFLRASKRSRHGSSPIPRCCATRKTARDARVDAPDKSRCRRDAPASRLSTSRRHAQTYVQSHIARYDACTVRTGQSHKETSVAFSTCPDRDMHALLPGAAIGDAIGVRGTFCCFVERWDEPGDVLLLSSAHVIADEGLAHEEFPVTSFAADEVRIVARLSQLVPVRFSSAGYENAMDAALARVEARWRPTRLEPMEFSDNLCTGMSVSYHTSNGVLDATVMDAKYDFAMLLKASDTEVARAGFRAHVLCDAATLSGDSGAAVLDER